MTVAIRPKTDIQGSRYRLVRKATVDPNQPFKPEAANVWFWISKPTKLAKSSLCAATFSGIVRCSMKNPAFTRLS